MIKCIAIDMDGTLLNVEHEISEQNVQAIKQAQAQGIEVVIATGRSYPEAIYILKEAGITTSVICTNGAEVRSPEGAIVATTPLDKTEGSKALDSFHQHDIYVEVFTNKGIYSNEMEKGISIFRTLFSKSDEPDEMERIEAILQERINFVEKVENYDFIFEDEEQQIYKFLAFSYDQKKLNDVQKELQLLNEIAISSSGPENLEINALHAQKGVALENFTKDRNISLEETMAIGDNYNDLSMFQCVGRAVAMGNADDAIKAQCHFVTDSHEESGVAKAIFDVLI